MKLERGVYVAGLSFQLTLQTEDVETHSYMGDHEPEFTELMDALQERATQLLTDRKEPIKK